MEAPTRLRKQLDFVHEIDRLKTVLRRSILIDRSRRENSAEHSWHIAVMAILLAEYATEEIDVLRVLQMVLVHDIVEIDAGDTYCYDEDGNQDRAARESRAAQRLFGILPADQESQLRALWEEFESCATPDARFAAALDRLQPLLHNLATEGETWRAHGVRKAQVVKRCSPIGDGAPDLWRYALEQLEAAVREGELEG